MTIQQLLDSRASGIRFNALLAAVHQIAYPGKLPAPRTRILARLQRLDTQTRDMLDTFATAPGELPSIREWPQPAQYMLLQRLTNALDVLSRLSASLPTPTMLSTSDFLADQDAWLFRGLWHEFGPFFLQNHAWRLSKGIPGLFEDVPPQSSP